MRVEPTAIPSADVGLVSLDEAKAHLGVGIDDDDDVITSLIGAATDHLDGPDGILHRSLRQWGYALTLDCWPRRKTPVRLPYGPVTAISSVVATDAAGVETTLAVARYGLLTRDDVGYAKPQGDGWPQDDVEQVVITYTAGGAVIPRPVKIAALMLVQGYYDHRDATPLPRDLATTNPTLERLLSPYRLTATISAD